jgi:hypothetical protein
MIVLRHKSKLKTDLIGTVENINTINNSYNTPLKIDLKITDNNRLYKTAVMNNSKIVKNEFRNLSCFECKINSKNPNVCWKKKSNKILHKDIVDKTNTYNTSLGKVVRKENYGILTGNSCYDMKTKTLYTHNNGITIVDIDFLKTKYLGKLDYFFEGSFSNTFGKQEDFIKHFKTTTIRTAHGGLHLIFKYNEKLLSKINHKHHIDILNDDKYIVGFNSVIEEERIGCHIEKKGLTYKLINNVKPIEMPQDLEKWILDNIYQKHSDIGKIKNKLPKKISMKTCLDYSYLINDNEVRDILKKLPQSYKNTFENWLKMTTFMKTIDRKQLWDEYSKSGNNYNYDNNCKIYDSIVDGEIMNNMVNHILDISETKVTLNYIKYKDINEEKQKPNEIFERTKLGYDAFKNKDDLIENLDHNCWVIKSDTGTGKTTSFKHYAKTFCNEDSTRFISIVSRVALGQEQYESLSEYGCECKFYKNEDTFKNGDNVIIQVDSLKRLFGLVKDIDKYVVFMDEFNSLVEHVIRSSTLKDKKITIYKMFLDIINNCKQCIMVDADISDVCFKLLSYCPNKTPYYSLNTFKHNNNVKATEVPTYEMFVECLKAEDKFIVCCDSKLEADKLYKELRTETYEYTDPVTHYVKKRRRPLKNPPEILLYTCETTEYHHLDNHDKVIMSPKIIYGLDSVMKRRVYCFYKEHTISPPQFLQQIARVRNIKSIRYLFYRKQVLRPNFKDRAECKKILQVEEKLCIDEFNFLSLEEQAKSYLELLADIVYKNDCYNTNKFCWFKKLLQAKGIIDHNVYVDTQKQDTDSSKELVRFIKQERIDCFDIENEYYDRINDYLKIPQEVYEADNFKQTLAFEMFIDPHYLLKHFDTCSILFKSDEDITKILGKINKDFNVNVTRTNNYKIHFLNELLELSQAEGFNPTKSLTTENAIKMIDRYKVIFRNRSKKNADFTKIEVLTKFIGKILKQLCDGNVYEKKRVMRDGIYLYEFERKEENIEKHRTIFNYRKQKKDNDVLEEYAFLSDSDDEEEQITPIKLKKKTKTRNI